MTNGQMFDSSVARGRTSSFPLNRVIAGWTEGLQLMTVGEKTRFWIPGELAYGTEPSAGGRPYGTLVFDVELFAFENPPPPPPPTGAATVGTGAGEMDTDKDGNKREADDLPEDAPPANLR